jgi:hypothetical protein
VIYVETVAGAMAITCEVISFSRPILGFVAPAATGRRISNGRARQRAQRAVDRVGIAAFANLLRPPVMVQSKPSAEDL